MKDHVIICGLGTIGFQTFKLLRQTQQKIVVITDNTQDEWRWQVEEEGGHFIQGDARNDKVLIKAGIQNAKAILALTDQDMVNVSIATDARNLNPQIKIIMRMFDPKLGKHIAKAYGVNQVFSTAQLAAPIFASSAHESLALAKFEVMGNSYFVFEVSDLNQALHIPLMDIPDTKITSGSTFLIARPAKKYKPKFGKFSNLVKLFNYLRSPIFANIRQFLFIVFCVILASAFFLTWAMSLSLIDAIYFVTTTITTVGYGDFNFSQTHVWLKLFGCFLMLSGAAALATLFSSITSIILSKKLPSLIGGQPIPRKKHIIIAGLGQFGHELVSLLLADNLPIVIIEGSEKERYSDDINRQVSLVSGDLRSSETLKRARVKKAKSIIVITNDDVENLSVSLAAKKINPKIFNVIHVFNYKLGKRLTASLSLDKVLSVPQIAAPYFAAAVFGDEIILALKWQSHLIFLSRAPEGTNVVGEKYLKIEGKEYKDIQIHSIPLADLKYSD